MISIPRKYCILSATDFRIPALHTITARLFSRIQVSAVFKKKYGVSPLKYKHPVPKEENKD